MITYEAKIFNGVNHPIVLYDRKNIVSNRSEMHFLKDTRCHPIKIIPQDHPLSAFSSLSRIDNAVKAIFLQEEFGARLDGLSNYFEYDEIIVSSRYADLARRTGGGGNVDFLDRLFVPVPVYENDPANNRSARKIGSIGFRKVNPPKMPQAYVEDLRVGRLPSVSAMQACVSMFQKYRIYCDRNTALWIRELESHLPVSPTHRA